MKEFLTLTCNQVPKIFYNNLSSLLNLYDCESYTLRNALTEILSIIIEKVLTHNNNTTTLGKQQQQSTEEQDDDDDKDQSNEEKESAAKESHKVVRKKLLDHLLRRVYDKNAHARTSTLTVLCDLCEKNCIPQDTLLSVLKAACDRSKDTSVYVRRRSIQLIQLCVRFYYVILVESQRKRKRFLSKQELGAEIRVAEKEQKEF